MKRLINFWKLDLWLEWLRKKIVIFISILSLLAILIGFFGTNHLIGNLIDNQALQQAKLSSQILQESWFSYSKNVVNRLKYIEGIQVVSNYHNLPNAIPNPATYAIELGKSLSSLINGRYGGEEFAVILPDTDANNAAIVTRGILKAVRRLNIVHATSNIESYVTISVGIASFIPNKTYQPKDLIKMADDALYKAKKQGRNCFVII